MSRFIDAEPYEHDLIIANKEDNGVRVSDIPTADAAPVRYGKWRKTQAYPHWLCCSECDKRFIPNIEWIKCYDIPTNYCPNCGAKMDGGINNDS